MCDTIGRITDEQSVLFGKNSDRHPKEVQVLEFVTGTLESDRYPTLEKYTPQFETLEKAHRHFEHPYPALISRPSWIWGAEMGVNEKGVAIGNEAVFTREKNPSDGLLGMDIVRLALHNSATAEAAVTLILHLLGKWGQGGDGSFVGTLTYSNSFMIADRQELYVLETAGTHWAVKSVESHASISNAYSLSTDFEGSDEASTGGDFSKQWANPLMEFFSKGRVRRKTTSLLAETGEPSWMGMRDILLYNRGTEAKLDRSMRSILINASLPKPTRTTASMVVEYPAGQIIAWCCAAPVATYHPFVPLLINGEELATASPPDPYTTGERRRRLTEALLKAEGRERIEAAQSARALEAGFEARLRPLLGGADTTLLKAAVDRCRQEAEEHEAMWRKRFG